MRLMKSPSIGAGMALLCASCIESKSPLAPTAIAGPAPPLAAASLSTNVPGVLSVQMPVEPGDSANAAFGITPYGYHGADHAEGGHTGWDIEYRIGAVVRAAAAGTVMNVFADASTPGRTTVHLEHTIGTRHCRTVSTNIAAVAADIVANAAVRAGQAIGTAGTVSGTIETSAITYAMTPFELDDVEYSREISNPNAVSPEPFLTASPKSLFDGLWSRVAYGHELVEPFVTNPRELSFPASRTWMRAGGDGPAGIRFSRSRAQVAEYEYALLARSGTVLETGAVAINVTARPYPLIALPAPTSVRLGLYDIVSNELRLPLADPGSPRATDFSGASVYRTTP